MATKNKQKGSEKLKNERREVFCQLHSGRSSRDYFDNATRSYIAAYGHEEELKKIEADLDEIPQLAGNRDEWQPLKARKKEIISTAQTQGWMLLRNPDVIKRCDYLLELYLEDVHGDREMGYVIAQRRDLASKVLAWEKVQKMKGRLEVRKLPEKITVSWEDNPDEAPKGTKKATPKAKKLAGSVEIQFEGDNDES